MIPFVKMHGIGNDFVMIDGFEHAIKDADLPDLSRAMCDRRFGIGADGLIIARPGRDEPFRMRMFNPDGSESEMCGNGVRCFALFLRDEGRTTERVIPVETGAGRLVLEVVGDRVRVDMGQARLTRGEIGIVGDPSERFVGEEIDVPGFLGQGTAVSMGNPHVVFFVDDPLALDLDRIGPAIEHHALFPNRINAHFVQVAARDHLIQRTWERGAGATLACGTGACAAAVAANENGLADAQIRIDLPGGTLEIEIAPDRRVFMTGPAQTVFRGEFLVPYARSPKAAAMAASP